MGFRKVIYEPLKGIMYSYRLMNRKIAFLTFTISILLFSFIPNDTSAQTMVNPFERFDMMNWNLDSTMYTSEYEMMTEANQSNPSEIYNINEKIAIICQFIRQT